MKWKIGFGVVFLGIIGALIWLALSITRVPAGHVGIVYSPNGGVQDTPLASGWHLVGILDKVIDYPVRMQTVEYKDIEVATSDGKTIKMDFAFTYIIEQDKPISVYNKFGPVKVSAIEDGYLRTRLWAAARAAMSKYSVIDVYGEKSTIAAAATQTLYANDVKNLGFIIENLTVGVPKPDAKTQEAIDARVTAAQELQRKEIELQTATKEKEIKLMVAQGNAQAAIEEARGRSEANQKLQMSITPELIQYELVKNLPNIKLPAVMGGGTSIVNLPAEMLK